MWWLRKTSCWRHDGTVDWQVSRFGHEYMKIFRLPLVAQYPVGTIPAEICQKNISRFRWFTYDVILFLCPVFAQHTTASLGRTCISRVIHESDVRYMCQKCNTGVRHEGGKKKKNPPKKKKEKKTNKQKRLSRLTYPYPGKATQIARKGFNEVLKCSGMFLRGRNFKLWPDCH